MVKSTAGLVCWTVTVYLVTIALSTYSADYTHYTWWSIASFDVYGFAAIANVESYFYSFFVGVQIQVITGVILMGFARCDVFEDALEKAGPPEYAFGNYLMHYFPLVWATLWLEAFDNSPLRAGASVWVSYGLYSDWSFFHNPFEVYGCESLPGVLHHVAPVGVTAVASVMAAVVASRVPSKFKAM